MSHTRLSSLLLTAALLGFGSTAFADRDEHRGEARHEEREHHEEYRDAEATRVIIHIDDHERVIVRDYYTSHRCPPGLRKKHNGCMPPGQEKRWAIGRPLPRDVIYHDLPYDLSVEIGAPPRGHRYVRVAADILLIAVGTGMVVDSIEDLGSMQ